MRDGGTITTEFTAQAWGDAYGDLVDKVGTVWGVDVAPKPEAE